MNQVNKKICYGCMGSYEGEKCPCGWKYDYTKEDAESLLTPGTLLNGGNYMVGRSLGKGGFGVTYIGLQQSELELKVAIKEYFPRKNASRNMNFSRNLQPLYRMDMTSQDLQGVELKFEEGKRRFIEEAKRLAELNELGTIVSVLGYFEENNTAYIVMEYIDGIDLYKYMRNSGRTMSMGEVKEYIYPIIRDLDRVHEKGIIHRDISPDNIMLTKSGHVKLIDFGASISKEAEDDVRIQRKNGFAPLEQYDTSGSRLGPWTDEYAMCATIYYLLSGRVIPDARDRQFFDKYEKLRTKNIMIPGRLDKILKKGLSVEYTKRYKSMGEMLRQLNRVHGKGRLKSWFFSIAFLMVGITGILASYGRFQVESDVMTAAGETVPASESFLEKLISREPVPQVESTLHYAVYDNLVYIRYTFDDGVVMLARSPVGTDSLSEVEYVTDGPLDCFCISDGYLYFRSSEDQFLYRTDISQIEMTPDEQQPLEKLKEQGKLTRISDYALNTDYGFTLSQGYVFSVVQNGARYEILRAATDGTETLVTELGMQLTNCVFYDGYIYVTYRESEETVLSRMRMDGCYYEELSRYAGDIPAMRITDHQIYYLFNADDDQAESYLGRISINGTGEKVLSNRTEKGLQYCYMTGVVDDCIYYTCSVSGMEAVNNLYCYSLQNGSNKQISSECGRYIVTSEEIDTIIFVSTDGSELRQMNKDGSNPHVMRGEDGGTGIVERVDEKSLAVIQDHVYYLDGQDVAYKKITD